MKEKRKQQLQFTGSLKHKRKMSESPQKTKLHESFSENSSELI